MSDRFLVGGLRASTGTLNGSVNGTEVLTGVVDTSASIVGELATAHTVGVAAYTGEYEVTPTVDGLELPTKHMYMTDDVTVLAIPFFEVGNTSGGNTIYIADEIKME